MRLRKLKYPIAILSSTSILGGKSAGLGSASRWNNNVADYFCKGGYDAVTIIDSSGSVYSVSEIILSPLSLRSRVLGALLYSGSSTARADVDMNLKRIECLSLIEFQNRIRELALSHPEWWQRHSEREEIQNMFDGCQSFMESINSIGILDSVGNEKLPGKSHKVVDLR